MSYKTSVELAEEVYEKARDKFLLVAQKYEVVRREKRKAESTMFDAAIAADEAEKNAEEYIINPHL